MKRIALAAVALLCSAATAKASPLLLPTDSPVYFQFNNLEQANGSNTLVVPGYAPATGTQGNWGVLNISSIQLGAATTPHVDISGGPAFFSDDGPNGSAGQITGIFYGILINGATTETGGFIDLFWHDAGSDPITANCMNGTTCLPDAATVSAFTSGTFLARLAFASGIDPLNAATFIKSTTAPTTIGAIGQADSFANVVTTAPGAWTNVLNGDWFTTAFGTRDIRFSNFFIGDVASWNAPGGTVGLRSNDPGRVFTAEAPVPVPEPATLTLLGVGLVALAARRRRKV